MGIRKQKKKKGSTKRILGEASRWSESKISSVYGNPKKPKERRADGEAHFMTETTRRSRSRIDHHHNISRRSVP